MIDAPPGLENPGLPEQRKPAGNKRRGTESPAANKKNKKFGSEQNAPIDGSEPQRFCLLLNRCAAPLLLGRRTEGADRGSAPRSRRRFAGCETEAMPKVHRSLCGEGVRLRNGKDARLRKPTDWSALRPTAIKKAARKNPGGSVFDQTVETEITPERRRSRRTCRSGSALRRRTCTRSAPPPRRC